MTDPLDAEIRRLMGQLSQHAPFAPTAGELSRRRPPHRARPPLLTLGGVLLAMVLVVAVTQLRDHSSTQVATGPTPTSQAPSLALGESVLPDPTFVTMTTPPDGLRFVDGGRRSGGGSSDEILLADSSGRSMRLLWTAASNCTAGAPVTTARDGTGAAAPSGSPGLIASSANDAPFLSSEQGTGALHWCEQGHIDINFIVKGLSEDNARSLARTVRQMSGSRDELTLDAPPGFVAGQPNAKGLLYALLFRPDDGPSSKPQLFVMVASAWTTDLLLLESRSGGAPVEVTLGGRKGFIVQAPGGTRYQSLTVVYDEHTVVTLSGDGLTPDQLVDAARSLRPGDPSVAPDVSGDPGRCSRLGLCG